MGSSLAGGAYVRAAPRDRQWNSETRNFIRCYADIMRAARKSHNPRGHSRPRETAFRMSVKGNNIMLITFKSHAAQDLIMMRDLAVTLLGIIGKHLGERGVITVEELPRAIHKLEAAVVDAKRSHPAEAPSTTASMRKTKKNRCISGSALFRSWICCGPRSVRGWMCFGGCEQVLVEGCLSCKAGAPPRQNLFPGNQTNARPPPEAGPAAGPWMSSGQGGNVATGHRACPRTAAASYSR